ncbi:hypothetical protein ACFC1I_05900 [Microbacterium sp. NPDC056044]|uniref:hypothetical protein n=1 Tax=Microbacterium sp. NPDC056044 TaxID=3345690 RepID=UPI0035E3A9F6
MKRRQRLHAGVVLLLATVAVAGCSTVPEPPDALGENYPGTCMPGELSWPTDFLDGLAGESPAIGGTIVGLRLEYVDSAWVWRLRSAATREDLAGDRVDDPSYGKESIVDVRTLEVRASHDIELTEAEQRMPGTSAFAAAQLSGEQWPSPLIIEMSRVMDHGSPAWRITTCDTATNEHSVITVG